MEDKKRYGRIQHARIHWILHHLTLCSFPTQLKSDLHEKRSSDLVELCAELDLKKDMVW